MSCRKDPSCCYYIHPYGKEKAHRCSMPKPPGEKFDIFWGFCPLTCERHRYAREKYKAQKQQLEFDFELEQNQIREKRK